ncbi:MAG: sodium:solute symporter family protein [bacterium]
MFYIWIVAAYLALLFIVALSKMRGVKTQEDFMVAGRKTPTLLLVGTLVCTWIGSGSLFGSAGLGFRSGFSALWFSAGAWVGIAIVYFLAHRVRRIAQYTLSDILETRYNQWARLLGTLTIIIAYLTIAGYQFRGGGRLLHILTGMDPILGGAISCAVTILFTMIAGLVSIIAVDLFNGIVMTLGVVIGVPLLLAKVGGWQQVQTLPADHFTVFGDNDAVWALGIFLPTFFLLLGESSMYQKFFSAKDERAARHAVIGMIIGVVVIESLLYGLAIIGSAKYFQQAPFVNPDGAFNDSQTETIILYVARHDLPMLAGGLMMAAAVAIILSTANTYLMIPSTNIARDLYQRFINPNVSPERIVVVQRILIVALGIIAYVAATFFESILKMALTAYTMIGAGITPALLAAFLWKRASVAGGVASIAAGMLVTVAITTANFILPELLMETDYIIIPAASASILTLIVVSLLTPPPPEEKWQPFWTKTK